MPPRWDIPTPRLAMACGAAGPALGGGLRLITCSGPIRIALLCAECLKNIEWQTVCIPLPPGKTQSWLRSTQGPCRCPASRPMVSAVPSARPPRPSAPSRPEPSTSAQRRLHPAPAASESHSSLKDTVTAFPSSPGSSSSGFSVFLHARTGTCRELPSKPSRLPDPSW